MTQPSDPARATRRVPRQAETVSDGDATKAITDVNELVDYMLQTHGAELPGAGTDASYDGMARAAFELLMRYVAERQLASLAQTQRFSDSRRQYSERIEELQGKLEASEASVKELTDWITIHDPMLVENERVIDELEASKAELEARHKQAQDEILRQADDIQQLTTDLARVRQELGDQERAQETQRRLRVTQADEAHRAEVERFRKENEALRAELGKTRAERDKAQGDLSIAKAAESKAVEAKLTSTREFDAFKRQVGSKIVQPILVIATSEQVAKGKGKTEDDWVKLFPKANFARFMIKVLEASINMAKGKATSYQLIDAVKMARAADIDPFYQIDPHTPSGEVLDLALNECHVWFTQLMLAFKEKVEQSARLSAELTEADRVVKEAVEGIATLRATLKKK